MDNSTKKVLKIFCVVKLNAIGNLGRNICVFYSTSNNNGAAFVATREEIFKLTPVSSASDSKPCPEISV